MFAAQPHNERSRSDLLVAQIASLGRLDDPRPPARERLEQALGPELAGRLIGALTGDKAMRSARLVA